MPENYKFSYYDQLYDPNFNNKAKEKTLKKKLIMLQKRNLIEILNKKNTLSDDNGVINEPPEVIEKMNSYKLFQEVIKESKLTLYNNLIYR